MDPRASVVFIVNGEDVEVPVGSGESPVRWMLRRALCISRNLARPLEDWELRNVIGVLLDPSRSLAEQPIPDDRAFLTLRVGCGGCA